MQYQDRMILIEGLDLAGKTTLCEGLTAKLREQGWKVVLAKNNLLGENLVGKKAKRYAVGAHTTMLETGALFLASHLYDTTLFKPPEEGIVHLQDSSWLRTISYNLMRETPIIPELADTLFEAHPRFGSVIYLTASIDVRKVRVQEREVKHPGSNTPGDFMSFTDPEFVMRHDRKLLETTRRFYPAVDVIDTSAMDADDTIDAGWRILQSKLLKGAT